MSDLTAATIETLLDEVRDEMAAAWGGDRSWLTTGTNVADLVRDWLPDVIERAACLAAPRDTGESVESLPGLEQWHTGEPNDIYVLQGHQLRDWLAAREPAAPRDQTEKQPRALCSNCGADLTDHCSACGAMQ